MKILIIEETTEELRANRIVLDNVNEVLNRFTDSLVGVHKTLIMQKFWQAWTMMQ